METSAQLSVGYYLDNFQYLIDFVAKRYWHVLSKQEQAFYQSFCMLNLSAKRLYVRFVSRKRDVFRAQQLNYTEIPDISQAAQQLQHADLIHINPDISLEQLLPLFTKKELLVFAERLVVSHEYPIDLHLLKTMSRADLDRKLLQVQCEQKTLIELLKPEHTIYQLLHRDLFNTFRLCFFGNLRQNLNDFVLSDLGLQIYENYSIEDDALLFCARSQLESHLLFYACQEKLEDVIGQGTSALSEYLTALPAPVPDDPLLTRRLERLIYTVARQMERNGALDEAVQVYNTLNYPPARERRCRIAAKQHNYSCALSLCQEILDSPGNEAEYFFACGFGAKVAKKVNVEWLTFTDYRPPEDTVKLERAVFSYGSNHDENVFNENQDMHQEVHTACIETLALEYLESGGECFYVENALFTGLLGLFIWDIIYMPVPGAFFNPFQQVPADFYTQQFSEARQKLLDQRFSDFSSVNLSEIIIDNYEKKNNRLNPLLHWKKINRALLSKALERIPSSHLKVIFKRILQDFRDHSTGLPDLIFFPETGGYELIEVKGPGDKLQKNQQRWMHFFHSHNIPHKVLHIRWIS